VPSGKTASAIRALHRVRPATAQVVGRSGEVAVPVDEVLVGDHVVVRPGERIAADGTALQGHSTVDESMLTGEAVAVPEAPGDLLTGGAINGSGRLVMQVRAVGARTVLAHIIALVEDAQAAKAPVQQLVDRVSAVFVPVVVALAFTTLVGWWWTGQAFDQALLHAVAVLVIACPCALGLATPAAIMAGTGVAARYGILIKDAQVLEHAQRVDTVAFDKTGTLTEGRPRLTALVAVDAQQMPAHDALAVAAGLRSGSGMPWPAPCWRMRRRRRLPRRWRWMCRRWLAAASRARSRIPAIGWAACRGWRPWAWTFRLLQSRPTRTRARVPRCRRLPQCVRMPDTGNVQWVLRAWFSFADEPKPGAAQAVAGLGPAD